MANLSGEKIFKTINKALSRKSYSFIVANLANPDMVGHTGNLRATIKGLEYIDQLLGQLAQTGKKNGWQLIITADHGNVEEMVEPIDGAINPEHTRNPVPFVIISPDDASIKLRASGTLADVSPTILKLLGLEQPKEMTGESLIIS